MGDIYSSDSFTLGVSSVSESVSENMLHGEHFQHTASLTVDQVIQLFFDSYGFHEEPLYRHNNNYNFLTQP